MDKIEVRVELDDSYNIDNFIQVERLRKDIMAKLRTVCQLDIPVILVSGGTLKRF